MGDMLFYQNYSSVGDVITIVICLIFGILLSSTYTVKQENLILFKLSCFIVGLSAFSDIVYHILLDDFFTKDMVPMIYMTRMLYYIGLIFTFVLFCVYISNLVKIKRKSLLRFIVWAGFSVFVFFEVASPWTHFGFYIDSDMQIHQNYYKDFFRYAYCYYLTIANALLFVNRKKLIMKMFRCIVSVMFLSFLVMMIQSELMMTSYCAITFTFPIMATLFLFHYNAYDVETGTLDYKAFDSYIKDMGDKKFSMISLFLEDMDASKMGEMSKDFLHFNEKFFKNSCTFRLRDDKLTMIYEDAKNPDSENKIAKLLMVLKGVYIKHKIDYKILIIHSNESLKSGDEYRAFDDYLERKMNVNALYRASDDDIVGFLKEKYILSQLREINQKQDLDDERVKVFCQPVYNVRTGTFTSAEALMRLVLPEYGMIFPDEFIPLAERHEYIHGLSRIILNKTCKQIKMFEKEGYQLERVSVNFSISELRYSDFCEDVIEIIKSNGIGYGKIAVELTESRNEKDFENVKKIMSRLQDLGVKFYLDDFGTGYSNFERIMGLPIDIVKFDRSLTIMAGRDEESRFMVESFSEIFKKSNYQILFEGVENEKDEKQCKDMNAIYLQGYKYSKPIPIEHLGEFLLKTEISA